MEELVSPDVRVVLSVKEGKGFEQILQPTLVVATLNGHSLETEAIEPSPMPQYAHDLVWEVDKSRLRKMRSAQVPLKLECFTFESNDSRDKLGYLLLSIRSAQIITRNSNVPIKANWHKLLGLRNDLKAHKPELLIALSICERKQEIPNVELKLGNLEEHHQSRLQSNEITPVLLHDERLIQLGPLNTCHDLFLMSITAISATNLDLLLPKQYYTSATNNLHFYCQILENDVYFVSLSKDYKEIWSLNEKIVVRIRSSLKVLKQYFQLKPHLFIYLRYNNDVVGESQVNLQSLVPTDNIQEFLEITENNSTILTQRCVLRKTYLTDTSEMQYKKSCIDLQLKLQYLGPKSDLAPEDPNVLVSSGGNKISLANDKPHEEHKNNFKPLNVSEIDCHRNPGGDFGKHTGSFMLNYPNDYPCTNKQSLSCEIIRNQSFKMICSQSADTMLCHCNNKDCSKSIEAYHCYSLNVSLISIKLSSPKQSIPNIEFRFHHPKTDVISTFSPKVLLPLNEKVQLQDIGCKLHFVSAADEIRHLLLSFPPKISIYDAGGNTKTCLFQSVLDVKPLFHQNKSECRYDILMHDTEKNKFGHLEVMLDLKDLGPYYRIRRRASSENLGPPILDDSLAYKVVDELETWKERQKEIFKVELKRKEERHLNLLSEEWQKHRENLESKLACSVEQCKMLANSLNNATEDLRTRRLKSLEKETRLIKANEDLQWRYEMKVQELKESLRVMQEELTSKINILEKRKAALEAQVEPVRIENERLRVLVTKQSEEIEAYQKGSLTQDQTASLLQELKTLEEKLHNAQESKSFFKQQWAKAVREIHRMKTEYQQAIQVQIKNNKEELQNLDLEEILCADSTALTDDQILLGKIQKEIDVIRPKPSFGENDTYNQVFTPNTPVTTNMLHSNNSKGTAKKSEDHDERLQALIEERDSLLKTGSYTIDDTVIVKLNTEIRSLMMR